MATSAKPTTTTTATNGGHSAPHTRDACREAVKAALTATSADEIRDCHIGEHTSPYWASTAERRAAAAWLAEEWLKPIPSAQMAWVCCPGIRDTTARGIPSYEGEGYFRTQRGVWHAQGVEAVYADGGLPPALRQRGGIRLTLLDDLVVPVNEDWCERMGDLPAQTAWDACVLDYDEDTLVTRGKEIFLLTGDLGRDFPLFLFRGKLRRGSRVYSWGDRPIRGVGAVYRLT